MKNKERKAPISAAITVLMCIVLCILGLGVQAQMASPDEASDKNSGAYTDSVLSKADISLSEDDSVILTEGEGYVAFNIIRAYDVQINFCGEMFTVKCSEGTVADAVAKAGITLTKAHKVTPDRDTKLTPDCKITILADSGVVLTADGDSATYITTANTVGEFLLETGVFVGEFDIVNPALDERLYEGMEVTVSRVEYKEETTTEIIDYGFVSEETSSLASGTSKIKQYGIEGERTIVSKNMYVDGELFDSEVISDEVTREPVDQIKLIGIGKTASNSSQKPSSGASVQNSAGTFVDSSGKTVSYKKKLTGTSTAYYAAEGAITSTGVPVHVGGVAVNPNVIPYGSKLYIVSSDGRIVYGYATAVDTGGALMSGSVLVDVFYPTYNECMNWGRRNVTVYVLS